MKAFQKNPVLWLIWAILAFAVLAGCSVVAIAMQGADRALPGIYHWEGASLDADFERAKLASRLGLEADLVVENGQCTLAIRRLPASGDNLQLLLISGSDARLDRAIALAPAARPGVYAGSCEPLQRGRWRVSLQDNDHTWHLRGQLDDTQTRVSLGARNPGGQGT